MGSAEGEEKSAPTPAAATIAATTTVEEKKDGEADQTEVPSSKRARVVEEPNVKDVKDESFEKDDKEPLDDEMVEVAEEDLVIEEDRDAKQQPAATTTTAMGEGEPSRAPKEARVAEESALHVLEPHVEEPLSEATSLVPEGDALHEGLQGMHMMML